MGRLSVGNMWNFREWSGCFRKGVCFLFLKMFRWKLEAGNCYFSGRG